MKLIKDLIKAILFVAIGIGLFLGIQKFITPRWNYPNTTENIYTQITAFENLDENIEQVIFLGTSHMMRGVSPLEIYQENKIVSYNLGTSIQTLEGSYFLAKEAFRTQDPKVIVLDVSSLFFSGVTSRNFDVSMRYILDSLPMNETKVEMARAYAEMTDLGNDTGTILRSEDTTERFISCFIPFLQYHSRWNEIGESDFRDYFAYKDDYTAGYHLGSVLVGGSTPLFGVNALAAELMAVNGVRDVYVYENGIRTAYETDEDIYSTEIVENNVEYLVKLRDLCEQNGATLLLTKIPTIISPISYTSAWTKFRYNAVKEVADRCGIDFLDLQYDADLGIDVTRDFYDGGMHLNANGTSKVSRYLGAYLKDRYSLEENANLTYENYVPYYNEMFDLVQLQIESDPIEYLNILAERSSRYTILMTVKYDMRTGLMPEEAQALSNLGLQIDWDNELKMRRSLIAVIDGGDVKYEAVTNRLLNYTYTLDNGSVVDMTSAGYYSGSTTSIQVDGNSMCRNSNGLNISVYDKEMGIFVDVAAINFCDVFDATTGWGSHTVSHSTSRVSSALRDAEFIKVLQYEN